MTTKERAMPAWNGWYHVTGNTYGTWLPGDPRGWRECHRKRLRLPASRPATAVPPALPVAAAPGRFPERFCQKHTLRAKHKNAPHGSAQRGERIMIQDSGSAGRGSPNFGGDATHPGIAIPGRLLDLTSGLQWFQK